MHPRQQARSTRGSRRAIVCDFDGTITNLDTGQLVLTRLSDGDWRYYHEQYVHGAFSFEECLRRQYSHVTNATKATVLRLVDEHVRVRPGFEELLVAAALADVPIAIASYGLDFCIEHVLGRIHNGSAIQIYSPRTEMKAGGVTLAFLPLRTEGAVNLKDDVVRQYKQKGFEMLFVGDGASDLPAVKEADVSFAIEGSELATTCEREGIQCATMADFWPMVDVLTR